MSVTIPRVAWPGKPTINLGNWINEHYTSSVVLSTNFGPTFVGDFYLNFGVVGVLAGMLLLGLILRIAHQSLLMRSMTAPGILASIILIFQLCVRFEGNVGSAWSTCVFFLAPVVVMHLSLRGLGLTAQVRWDHQPPARVASNAGYGPGS